MNNKIIKNYFDKLINSRSYNFSYIKLIPKNQGVYIIYSKSKEVLHVGRSVSGKDGLQQRLNNHRKGLSSFVRIFFAGDKNKLNHCQFKCIEIKQYKERAYLEAYAIGMLCPKHIK